MEYLIEGLNILLLFFIILVTHLFHKEDIFSYNNPFSYLYIGLLILLTIDIMFIFLETPSIESSLRTLLRTGIFTLIIYIFLFKDKLLTKRNF